MVGGKLLAAIISATPIPRFISPHTLHTPTSDDALGEGPMEKCEGKVDLKFPFLERPISPLLTDMTRR